MTKTEYAQEQVARYLANAGEPVKLVDLIKKARALTVDDDPRWIGVALLQLNKAGAVRYVMPGCDDNHNHNGECAVEVAPA
jgi:hypothetical protein